VTGLFADLVKGEGQEFKVDAWMSWVERLVEEQGQAVSSHFIEASCPDSPLKTYFSPFLSIASLILTLFLLLSSLAEPHSKRDLPQGIRETHPGSSCDRTNT